MPIQQALLAGSGVAFGLVALSISAEARSTHFRSGSVRILHASVNVLALYVSVSANSRGKKLRDSSSMGLLYISLSSSVSDILGMEVGTWRAKPSTGASVRRPGPSGTKA